MKPLITPTVNLNGNSARDLVEQLCRVMDALRDAEEAFAKNADVTHGRNFQTRLTGDAIAMQAAQAWGERRRALFDMREGVERLALAIQAQGH